LKAGVEEELEEGLPVMVHTPVVAAEVVLIIQEPFQLYPEIHILLLSEPAEPAFPVQMAAQVVHHHSMD